MPMVRGTTLCVLGYDGKYFYLMKNISEHIYVKCTELLATI